MKKGWENWTAEDWDEIIGGILQHNRDFPPAVEIVEPTEAQKREIARIMAEVEREEKQQQDR